MVSARGNVNLTASDAGAASDLLVRGSDVTAGNNASLKADGDIALQAAQNTASLSGSNSSSSGSTGVSMGLGAAGGSKMSSPSGQ